MEKDAILLRQFVERGETASLRVLVDRHVDAVYSAALRRVGGDVQLAEDVVQQVFIAMTRQARRLCDHPFLGAWLHRTTRNQAANVVRAERRRKERETIAMSLTNQGEVDWRAVAPVLDEAIDALRETDRRAVVLRFFEHRTYAEIGEAMSLGEDGARKRVERALDRLRLSLERRSIKSPAAALAVALTANGVLAAPPGLSGVVGNVAAAITPITAAPGGTLLAFMSTTKTSIGIGSAAIVLTAVLITQPAWEEARAAEQTIVASSASLAASRSQHSHLSERLRQIEDELARLESAVAARATAVTAPQGANAAEQQGEALLAQYPYLREAFDSWREAQFNFSWTPFLQARAATPEQRAEFFQMMRDAVKLSVQESDDGTWWTRVFSPTDEQFHAQITEIFGQEGLRELRIYQQQAAARKAVAQVAGALSFTDEPLRADQISELVGMLYSNKTEGANSELTDIDPDILINKTHRLLSPQQQKWVEAALVRGQSLDAVARLLRRESGASSKGQP